MKLIRAIGLSLCVVVLAARAGSAATITVNAGGDLQAAIDAAKPGDTIVLQAGATFTGPYRLRAKGGTTYITIQSAPNGALPPSGTRITAAASSMLAKIKSSTAGSAVRTDAGATYWRLQLLEFLPGSSTSSANLVEFGGGGTSQSTLSAVPQHLEMDRCYLHGDPSYGQRRGLALNSGEARVVNSYFADFKGVLQDTQAIAGWNGPGPFLIENNYLEAAGENVMFGGTDPSIPYLVPSGITLRRNLISKPLKWMSESWTVKNIIELKNAENVLIEGNTIEHNWSAGQQGYSIVLTPRNQSNTAPWSVVKNVTIQNNVIRDLAAVFDILGYDDIYSSQQTQDVLIRNNLIYGVSTAYGIPNHASPGRLAIIGAGPKNITFDHNTADNNGSSTIFIYGGTTPTGVQILGFELTNNLLRSNAYAVYGDKYGEGNVAFSHYTPSAIVLHNTFANESAKYYPVGNDFPTTAQWLADFASVSAANYQLVSSSLSNNAGTDGKDLGVDFAELSAALSGSATPAPTPTPSPSPGGSTPYGGTPAPLPGTVQFENYDAGGEGVAYHDTTSGNTGGTYRSNNVDVQATTDAGGGYIVGWVQAGEWLNYTVKVAAAGTYAIDVRIASNGAGGTFHIEVNGVNKTGMLTVPNTGGWQTWQTITKTGVALAAGQQVIRVVMDSIGPSGAVANFNWFAVR